MSIRVHDLAKHCGLSNKEMIEKLHAMNYPVKSHSSTVDKITAESIEKEYGYVPPKPESPPAPAPPPAPVEAPALAPVVAAPVKTDVVEAKAPLAAPKPAAPKPEVRTPVPAQVALPQPTPAATQQRTATAVAPAALQQKPAPKPVSAPARPVVPLPPRPTAAPVSTPAPPPYFVNDKGNKVIQMKPPVVVRDLALRVGTKPHLLLAELMELNVFANLNETIGEDIARKICERHGFIFELEKRERGAGAIHAPPKKVVILEEGVKRSEEHTSELQS